MTLLEQGYRLNGAVEDVGPHAVEFLKTIHGESVDWTYGAALSMGRNPVPKPIHSAWIWITLVASLVVGEMGEYDV